MKEIMAKHKATVIITEQLAAQVACLHNQCPSATEWSGVLVYEMTEGSPDKLDEPCTLRAHAVFPMDFGNGAYTEYESDSSIFKLFDIYPQVDPVKKDPKWFIGHIHSHHNMSCFFSGTDTDELLTNVKNLPMYLSLIVNYACLPVAKLAVATEAELTEIKLFRTVIRGMERVLKSKEMKTEKATPAYVIDCDVRYEQKGWFVDQLQAVKEKKRTTPVYTSKWNTQYDNEQNRMGQWPGRTPGLGFSYGSQSPKGETKEETPKRKTLNNDSRVYGKAMSRLAELITLDENELIGPYAALEVVGQHVDKSMVENYHKALTVYFLEFWYPNNFEAEPNMVCTEQEVLTCLVDFLKYHRNMWIATTLTEWANELKSKLGVLRKV